MEHNRIERLSQQLAGSDAIVIGAGAGLSTSAGFTYTGERFAHYFPDFIAIRKRMTTKKQSVRWSPGRGT